jgi:23S rRNA (cytosine1962-C5)-methyltransferase
MYRFLSPSPWPDYELLDSGGFAKLERFGAYVLARPEPQAIWAPALPEARWRQADATFTRLSGADLSNHERGQWERQGSMPEQWTLAYERPGGLALRFRLGLSAFKHVGLFPEQDANWQYIHGECRRLGAPRVLNLFAYTGGASLAARAGGAAEVVHVDAVRQVNAWARENMQASGLDGIRFIAEDAVKFARRELKRGHRYQGVVLDPPAYGRGPEGERWHLEEGLGELLELVAALLDSAGSFLVLNVYSLGLSPLVLENLVGGVGLEKGASLELGELFVPDAAGRRLPLGSFLRAAR